MNKQQLMDEIDRLVLENVEDNPAVASVLCALQGSIITNTESELSHITTIYSLEMINRIQQYKARMN